MKKYHYKNHVTWKSHKQGLISAGDKPGFKVASPPEFSGHPGIWTPEDLLIASINSCVMTTFLYFIEKRKIDILDYKSEAEGQIEMVDSKLIFTEITIKPIISIKNDIQIDKIKEVISLAEKYCLISNSLKIKISIIADIKQKES